MTEEARIPHQVRNDGGGRQSSEVFGDGLEVLVEVFLDEVSVGGGG